MEIKNNGERVRAIVLLSPLVCPKNNVDCWECPCFSSVDPDNVGEPVVVCNYKEAKE